MSAGSSDPDNHRCLGNAELIMINSIAPLCMYAEAAEFA